MNYRIRSLTEKDDTTGRALYWSNVDGWSLPGDTFTTEERDTLDLPIGGTWEALAPTLKERLASRHTAIFSIEDPRSRTGFREVGTKGRSILRDATPRQIMLRAAKISKTWHNRAVRVEEHSDSIYAPASRTWVYHCACEDSSDRGPRPCCFHQNTDAYTGITSTPYNCTCQE